MIPLAGYLAENISKKPIILNEFNSDVIAQDDVQIKRNVYYIILDAMVAIETLEPFGITTKKEVLDKLSNTELRYIDKSQSSYSRTKYSITSIMFLDHLKPELFRYPDLCLSRVNLPSHLKRKWHDKLILSNYSSGNYDRITRSSLNNSFSIII
jgi:hypothetical protein